MNVKVANLAKVANLFTLISRISRFSRGQSQLRYALLLG